MCKPWKDPRLKGKTDMKTMQEKRAGLREKDES